MGDTLRVKATSADYDQPLEFYTMGENVVEGAVVREPVLLWKLFGRSEPFQGLEQQSVGAARVVGEIWSAINVPWYASRTPLEGMMVKVLMTGEMYEIRGVLHVNTGRREYSLTCRLVR